MDRTELARQIRRAVLSPGDLVAHGIGESIWDWIIRAVMHVLKPTLDRAHIPTLAQGSTPGTWMVHCAACSAAAQDYVHPCAEGRWDAPARLVAAAGHAKLDDQELLRTEQLGNASEELEQLRAELERARPALDAAHQLNTTLRDVLSAFVHKGHPGKPCLQSGWIDVAQVEQWHKTRVDAEGVIAHAQRDMPTKLT